MRPSPASPRRPAARKDRGAALLVVIVSTAILTAIAVDLAYSTRVSLLTAANSRDELRAEYLARGAVQLSRLVLKFQKELDDKKTAGVPGLQIYNVVPITNALTDGIFAAPGAEGSAPSFVAKIEDEGRKVNAQLDGGGESGPAQVAAFLALVGDPQWDPLFDREDEHGQRVTRTDVAVNLYDWTDAGSVASAFNTANPYKPFEDGFGDENQPYYRYDDPYKTKNDRFDSLDELFLVAGIDDAFMAAFAGRLTVYMGKNGQFNVNSPVPQDQLLFATIMADSPQQPPFSNVSFAQELAKAVALRTQGGLFKLQPEEFALIVQQVMGVTVNGSYLKKNPLGPFTDRSTVYRILATGAAGAAERRVDAVVFFDPNPNQPAQEASDLGRLLHWREE